MIWIPAVLAALAMVPADPPKKGSVSGLVVDAQSGAPVGKCVVRFVSRPATRLDVRSRADGTFEANDLDPATYRIFLLGSGYVEAPQSRRTVVEVSAGESVRDVKIAVLRTGSVSGRILDVDGDPMLGASVRVAAIEGVRTGFTTYATTDDRGQYRAFHVPPGIYRVSATFTGPRDPMPPSPLKQASTHVYKATYYPGTFEPAQASAITVEPGAELTGYDIRLTRTRGFTVRGRVIGIPHGSHLAQLDLFAVQGRDELSYRDVLVYDDDGTFQVTDILPGRYHLRSVLSAAGTEKPQRNALALEVGEADLEGVEFRLSLPVNIKGRVVLPTGRKFASSEIALMPHDTLINAPVDAKLQPDGSFLLKDVTRGEYRVAIWPPPPDDLYVAAITSGDADLLEKDLTVGETDPAPIEIRLAANGGTAECSVKGEKGNSIPDASVLAVPEGPKERQTVLHGRCRTGPSGTCTIPGIAPGMYQVFAFAAADLDFDPEGPDELKRFAKYSKALKLNEGERIAIELQPAAVK